MSKEDKLLSEKRRCLSFHPSAPIRQAQALALLLEYANLAFVPPSKTLPLYAAATAEADEALWSGSPSRDQEFS